MLDGYWHAQSDSPRAGVRLSTPTFIEATTAGHATVCTRGFVPTATVSSLAQRLTCESLETPSALLASDGESLVLARGSLGGAPLYYAWTDVGRRFVASSQLGAVVNAVHPSPRVSERNLASFATGLFPAERTSTPYEGVFRLDAGESLLVGSHGIERRRVMPKCARFDWLSGNDEDLATELRRHIDAAISRAIGGARRVAVLVGGVDSCSLLAALVASSRGANRREVHALTVDSRSPSADAPYVDAICEAFGIVPIHFAPDARCFATALDFVVDDAPAMLETREQVLNAHARALGAELVLSGNHGDEVFGGELGILGSALFRSHPLRALRTAARTRFPLPESPASLAYRLVLCPWLRPGVPQRWLRARQLGTLRRQLPWARPRLFELCEDALTSTETVRASTATSPQAYFEHYASSLHFMECAEAQARVEALTGLPRVDPFRDLELVRFLTSIRPDLLHSGGLYRGLLRLAMRGDMPEHVRMRVDKADPGVDIAHDVIDHPSALELRNLTELARRDLVDPKAFSRACEEPERGARAGALLEFHAAEAFLRHADRRR